MAKRRKRGDGGVSLRKDGRWEGRVVIGYDGKELPVTKNALAKTKGVFIQRIIPALGNTQLDRLTTADIQHFYGELKQNGRPLRTELYGKGFSECEKLLAEMIAETKAEIASEREQLRAASHATDAIDVFTDGLHQCLQRKDCK